MNTFTTKERESYESYLSSLVDLNVNSKPFINMLTMLAEENIEQGQAIVAAVEHQIAKVLIYFILNKSILHTIHTSRKERKTWI